jgi:cytochrome c
MKFNLAMLAVLATAASPAFATGDATKGEATFKQCQTCHSIIDPDGKVVAGKGAKIGPDLYGVFGRQAGTYPGFKYGASMVAAGAAGLIWDEAHFVEYVQNPGAFLKKQLGDNAAVAKMAFKVKDAATAEDVYAYLIQFSPDAAAAPADPAAAPADPAAAPADPAAPAPAP